MKELLGAELSGPHVRFYYGIKGNDDGLGLTQEEVTGASGNGHFGLRSARSNEAPNIVGYVDKGTDASEYIQTNFPRHGVVDHISVSGSISLE